MGWKKISSIGAGQVLAALPVEVVEQALERNDRWGRPIRRTAILCSHRYEDYGSGDQLVVTRLRTFANVGSPNELALAILQDQELWETCPVLVFELYEARFGASNWNLFYPLRSDKLNRLRELYAAQPLRILADLELPSLHRSYAVVFEDESAWHHILKDDADQ